eukprot:63463-Pelagomonas_calceolata.AAC.4
MSNPPLHPLPFKMEIWTACAPFGAHPGAEGNLLKLWHYILRHIMLDMKASRGAGVPLPATLETREGNSIGTP